MLKEGLYEDYSLRETPLGLARFKTTSSGDAWRSLKDYAADLNDNQTAVYYAVGPDLDRLASSPQAEGFCARGIEVLLLSDHIDSFWAAAGNGFRRQAVQIGDAGTGRSQSHPSPGGVEPAPVA